MVMNLRVGLCLQESAVWTRRTWREIKPLCIMEITKLEFFSSLD